MMDRITTDANGYEIDVWKRGLRLCSHCNLVMSEGWYGEPDYACSDRCMEAQLWIVMDESIGRIDDGVATYLTRYNMGMLNLPENKVMLDYVYYTDWEGDDSHDDAVERLMSAPYKFTEEEMHNVGCHEDNPEDWRNCTICQEAQ